MNLPQNKPCKKCQELGRDKDGNNLFLMSHGKGYVCRQNGVHHKPYYEWLDGKEHEPEEYENNMIDISQIPTLPHAELKARGIRKDVAERFGVRVEYDPSSRDEVAYYYPLKEDGVIVGYKKRSLPKTFLTIGDTKGKKLEPMGLSECSQGGKKLVVVGGQDDLGAAYQMLADYSDSKYGKGKFPPNVISLTRGENDIKCISDYLDRIQAFEEVILCLDMDEVGKASTHKLCGLLGPKAKVMKISEKDPNDMLKKGKQSEFINAFFNAKMEAPDGLLSVGDVYEEAIEMPMWGRLWPWPSLNKLTYGRRDGEGIYVGSAVKGGKTEWKNQMSEHIIKTEGKKIFVCAFEQNPGVVVKGIAGKLKRKQFHNPEHAETGLFTQEDLINAVNELRDKVIIFRASFSDVGNGNMWDRLKPAIRHAVVAEGVKDVFIDPITQLTDGMTPSETETELRRFSNEIQGMAQDLGFFYYCFAHLKEPSTGLTHEEGGAVKVAQFRGSRAMAEKTKFQLGIIRNQFADDETERNTSTFHLLLNSGFGKTGKFDVFYDDMTGSYLEPERSF